MDHQTASAEIDLAAIRRNVGTLRDLVAPAAVMVVVKADGYGHGMVRAAEAARAAGADWLGAAIPDEALGLRAAGDTGRVLCWLYGPDEDLTPLVAADVDVSIQSVDQLARVAAAAESTGHLARVHLKIDTGLTRNGCDAADWPALCAAARTTQERGGVEVVAVWSHLAAADEPGHPSVPLQQQAFDAAYQQARAAGLDPQRHLANSAGAMILPDARFDLVRIGIAAYGIEPAPGLAKLAGITLTPAMTLRAQLANVHAIGPGVSISYGCRWTSTEDTVVGLVPLGYGDGVPRHGTNRIEVEVAGRRAPNRGTVCMDQFVVDLGPDGGKLGDEAVLFGPGTAGEPTAEDWADWCGTIAYEIVTRIGARVPRRYRNGTD
ncbi:alanine racemase [Microlunatus sp. GCM10028923]|uniref:alanine racemase n=1 Tax=Microlunatus sp. GCM10028923 TaxID=3273400 RepID=UPI00360AF653